MVHAHPVYITTELGSPQLHYSIRIRMKREGNNSISREYLQRIVSQKEKEEYDVETLQFISDNEHFSVVRVF